MEKTFLPYAKSQLASCLGVQKQERALFSLATNDQRGQAGRSVRERSGTRSHRSRGLPMFVLSAPARAFESKGKPLDRW